MRSLCPNPRAVAQCALLLILGSASSQYTRYWVKSPGTGAGLPARFSHASASLNDGTVLVHGGALSPFRMIAVRAAPRDCSPCRVDLP
jgi:hypothetical protein